MRPLSAAELMDAWERGLSGPAHSRGLALLTAACPDLSTDAVSALSIGERDRRLLTLREWSFGPQMSSVTNCIACGERLEWTIEVADLRAGRQASASPMSVEMDGHRVSFRLPNIKDLAAVAACADPEVAREVLLERAVLKVQIGDREIAARDLPDAVTEALVQRMAKLDPQAEVQLDLSCPECGHRWRALFDIESFFWAELSAWARRLLLEVHTLASAYGWREADILNLSAWRRQLYLGLAGG